MVCDSLSVSRPEPPSGEQAWFYGEKVNDSIRSIKRLFISSLLQVLDCHFIYASPSATASFFFSLALPWRMAADRCLQY